MQQGRRRGLYPLEWGERLQGWFENQTILELAIGVSPRDGRTPVIDLGEIHIPLHAAWQPPLGALRKVLLKKTARGRYFFVPAEPEKLPQGEFDLYRQMFFRERLRQNRSGRYFFRLASGLILVPLQQEEWKKYGADNLLGQVVELTGWPRCTSVIVVPRFGFENITMTDQISDRTRFKEAEEKAVEVERAVGLIRLEIDEIPTVVSAGALLGITPEEKLSKKLIATKARRAKAATSPDRGVTEVEILGSKIPQPKYYAAIDDARKVLEAMVDRGVTLLAAIEKEVEEIAETPPVEPEKIIVECSSCGARNQIPIDADRRRAICGRCKADLFPEEVAKYEEEQERERQKIAALQAAAVAREKNQVKPKNKKK